jgi:hypothetical protein
VGTPFFLFTDGDAAHAKLFATGYQPDPPVTLGPTGVGTTTGTLNGSVNPEGAAVNASFQFGSTTLYGSTTPAMKTAVSNSPVGFSANLTGLAPGTTIHYRAMVVSDFGTFLGADQVLNTTALPVAGHALVGKAKVKGTTASVLVRCTGPAGATCTLAFRMTVTEKIRGHRIIAVTARKKPTTHKVTVTVGTAPTITLTSGQSKVVKISLNRTGRRLLAKHRTLKVTLRVKQILGGGRSKTLSQTVTFKTRKHHRH